MIKTSGHPPVTASRIYYIIYFSLTSTNLTDKSQLVNLHAIAELSRLWHFRVRVTGAADSATGTADGNVSLSKARADYISKILQERGVSSDMIQTVASGGIEEFNPIYLTLTKWR